MTLHVIDWFAGIDWGSERHQVCILNCSGEIVAEHNFPHTGNGLAEMGRWLANFTAETRNMAVAIEVPHGPVVDLLLDRGFVVYAINPKQLDRLRDRFSIAGSKDDRRDALVAASSLRTDSHLFRRVQASDPAIIELREWSRLAEELQQDRVRLSNVFVSNSGDIIHNSWSWSMIWPPSGCWSCGRWRRHRSGLYVCVQRRFPAYSRDIGFAGSTPLQSSTSSENRQSGWPLGSLRLPSSTFDR
jgi:hypothetical protein